MQQKLLIVLITLITTLGYSQNIVKGVISDVNGNPISDVEVFIDDTDFYYLTSVDGMYELELPSGEYVIKYSAFGFNDHELVVNVNNGDTIEENITLLVPREDDINVNLNQITVVSEVSEESEAATINMQKKSVEVKEVVGAAQMSKQGVSNVAGAVSKVSGVSRTEGSSDVHVRGLGDRYLNTSLNKMSIPSNRIDRKNINLDLFPSDIVENVAISKAFRPAFYANFGSGNIDVTSKRLSGKRFFSIGLSTGVNSNVMQSGVFGDFKVTPNQNTFGFKSVNDDYQDELINGSWMPKSYNTPLNREVSISAGEKFSLFGNRTTAFFTANYAVDHGYKSGEFSNYRANRLRRYYTDTEEFSVATTTQAMLVFDMKLGGRGNKIKTTHLLINQAKDAVFEGGRNGEGYVFDNQPKEISNFLRDQRYKQNTIIVNQINGEHANLADLFDLDWGLGYNYLNAKQPNTISNEFVIYDDYAQFTQNTNFQSSRGYQDLIDNEFTGYINASIPLSKEDSNTDLSLNVGANSSYKVRDFESQFLGISNLQSRRISSVDTVEEVLNAQNFNNGSIGVVAPEADTYNANVTIVGTYAEIALSTEKLDLSVGARFESNQQDLDWDVNNYVDPVTFQPRIGGLNKTESGIYPSINAKYEYADNQFFRVAASKTLSVPELRELSPFEYVDAQRRTFRGNPDLIFPDVYSLDLKWEMFPQQGTLISAAAFGKLIENPINIVQNVSSAGFFRPENTGEEATVFGIELESKFKAYQFNDASLNLGFNATKMWTNQDLFEFADRNGDGNVQNGYQFNGNTESKLQGAAEYLINLSLTYETENEYPTIATLTGNYTSDKIYSLGTPNSAINTDQLFNYNDNIIQKGIFNLNFILSQELSEKASLKLSVKNILNPKIKLIQNNNVINFVDVAPTNLEVGEATLESYSNGVDFSLGFKYQF
ncbi:outer membrane beta-barrel protein [Flavobacteriaceae bacterium Ap0902]|nr:outer membrane beta-barrel protein [Flavobacteriaceae bacterium Ap0902]